MDLSSPSPALSLGRLGILTSNESVYALSMEEPLSSGFVNATNPDLSL